MRRDPETEKTDTTAKEKTRPGALTILGGAVVFLLGLALCYVGYQILHILNPPNTYETVLTATVEEKVAADGVVLFTETLVAGAGDLGYLAEDGERFAALYKTQYLYMMYVWGHSYELATEEDWAALEAFCARLGGREDIWYATNIEIVDYMEAAARLQWTAAGDAVYNPSAQTVWAEADGVQYELPGGQLTCL